MRRREALLRAWASFSSKRSPILPGDEALPRPGGSTPVTWSAVARKHLFARASSDFEFSLVPQPFCGDIRSATVFVLALNPGLRPIDYFAEQTVAEFRRALLRNLQQRLDPEYPNVFLNPLFAWHSGFTYWHRRFREVLSGLAPEFGSPIEALSFLSKNVAVLQLVPYHSCDGRRVRPLVEQMKLESTRLVVEFVSKELVLRARNDIRVVALRSPFDWRVAGATAVLKGHARGGYFTERTNRELTRFLRRIARRRTP